MADEASLLAKWVFDTLSGDGTIAGVVVSRIYDGAAPQNPTYPYIVFTIIPLTDDQTLGARMWANFLLDVKVVSQGRSFATHSATVSRTDVLLHDKKEVSITGGKIKYSYRDMPIHFPEKASTGVDYTHQGNSFRVGVAAT
jgi:hypothetical protein